MGRNSIETFPARLQELREGKGLSRDQLAVAAGTSSHSVAKLEQGVRAPSLELAWRIAKALGCSLDALTESPAVRGRPLKGAPPAGALEAEAKRPHSRIRKVK